MKARVLDRTWNVVFVDQSQIDPENNAECDNPDTPGRQIRIFEDLKGELLLDTIIHEATHAAGWNLKEEFVEQAATDIAAIVWRPAVLRRVLDDPLVKKIALELIHDDLTAKDQSKAKRSRRSIREGAEEQVDQQGKVPDAADGSQGLA